MIVDCAHYLDGSRQSDRPISLDEAAMQCRQGGFVWLGMFEPSGEELDEVRESFGLHELAVEDAKTFHLRPKVEEYETGVQLVILRTARYNHDQDEVDFGEISIFVGPSFVITVRQGVASELHGARTRLEQHPKLLALGTNSVLWAILDQVIKGYAPVVADLESDIEQVEGTVFSGAVAPTERIYDLRREVTNFYRAVHPLLAVLTRVERNVDDAELRPYLRDVHDHLHLISEEVAAQKDLLATVLQANMAVISVEQTRVSVRQNSTMRAADDPGNRVPAADLHYRFLRTELCMARRQHHRLRQIRRARNRRAAHTVGPALGVDASQPTGDRHSRNPRHGRTGSGRSRRRSGLSTATPTLRNKVRMLGWPRWRPASATRPSPTLEACGTATPSTPSYATRRGAAVDSRARRHSKQPPSRRIARRAPLAPRRAKRAPGKAQITPHAVDGS